MLFTWAAAAGTPALLVTSFLPGTRADLLLPRLVGEQRARLGTALGRLAADLGGMPLLRRGPFLDGDLAIGVFPGPDDLPGWVAAHLGAFTHWSERQRTGLRRVAGSAQALLDGVTRACLVHSDFNPKNLLVDPETLEVTGLVDWEFARMADPLLAWALPLELPVDALAFVIAHEMAHHDLLHFSPAMVSTTWLGHQARLESQADALGLRLMLAAGFDGKGALEALDPAAWGPEPVRPAWKPWREHPPMPERHQAIQALLGGVAA